MLPLWTIGAIGIVLASPEDSPVGAGGDPTGDPGAAALVPPRFVEPLIPGWPDGADPEAGPATVVLSLGVDEAGVVTRAEVVSGAEPFVTASLVAARAARLEPAREGGVPVPVEVPLTLTFEPPPIVLEGVLRLAGGGAAGVPGATVRVAGRTVVTDADGRFHVRGLPPGAVVVQALVPAAVVEPVEVSIAAGEVVAVTLWAAAEVADPGILGTYRVGRSEVSRRSLDAADLRRMPGSLGDPLRALVNLPGTSRSPLDTGWLLVRGGDPRDTAVYVDGVRVPLVYHLGGFTSVVHPAHIDRVDFLPSGGGVRYGRSTAGTVDVVSRPAGRTPEARVGANLVFAGAYGSAPVGPVTLSASVRRSYLDAVLAPVLPDGAASSIPQFWDWQARADLGVDHGLFGFGFADALTLRTADGTGARLEIATERVHGRSAFSVAERRVVLTPFLAWEHLRLDVEDWGHTSLRQNWGGGLRAELLDDPDAAVSESVGVDVEAFAATVQVNELSRSAPVVMPDVYADVRFGRDTQVVAGLRVDTLVVGGQPSRHALSPRLSFTHPFSPRLRLEVEGGGRHQPPPWELVLGPPEGATLELDEAWGGSVSVVGRVGPVELTVDGYGRMLTRVTDIEADGSLGQGEGLAYGAEVSARLDLGRFTGLGRLSYTRSLRREEPDGEWLPSAYDQPVSLGLVGSYDLGGRWSIGGRFRYASGYPVGEDDLQVFDALTLENVHVFPHDGRVEAFHALDVKIARRFVFRTWRLDAWIDLQNVYNHRVPEPVVTGFSDLSFRDLGFGLITLPVFGVEGQWGGDPRRP